ncbi:hypothetical protein HK101_001218 [Irineochytrium annulatum]|nr:hypothetical protein HK101_001218 [Irineochytrium annulatum]
MSAGPHDADGVPEAGSGPWGRRVRYDRQFHSIADAVNYIGQIIVGGGLAGVPTAGGFLFPLQQQQRPGAAPAGVRAVEQLREVALPSIIKGLDGKVRRSLEGHWSCAVCQASNEDVSGLVEGEKADTMAWMMPCGHVFHKGCLGPWLKGANTCPTCRYEIHTDNDAYNAGVDRRMLKRKQATQAASAHASAVRDLVLAAAAAEPPTDGSVNVGLDEDGCVVHVEEHEDGEEVMKAVKDGRRKRGKMREGSMMCDCVGYNIIAANMLLPVEVLV